MVALIKDYHTNPDRELTEYTKRKKDETKENGGLMAPEILVENMNNTHLTLLGDKRLSEPSKIEAKIVALQILVKSKKDTLWTRILPCQRGLLISSLKWKLSTSKGKGTVPNSRMGIMYTAVYMRQRMPPPPKEGEKKTKMWKECKYDWCKKDRVWVIHDKTDRNFDSVFKRNKGKRNRES